MIKKGYTDGPFGQVHWRKVNSGVNFSPDLYCFHPAPFSGLAFTGIMPALGEERRVIAPDYPGYGGSDPAAAAASIDIYAAAMTAVIDDCSAGNTIDVLGFHTGCFVAAALSIAQPERIRKAVLIDCPSFNQEQRDGFRDAIKPLELTSELACLEGPWASGVTKRLESQPIDRAFEMFVEQLRPGAQMNDAFSAAFSYDWKKFLPGMKTNTLVLATGSPLLAPSRNAAATLPNAGLVERLDITRAVLDEAAGETAAEVLKFLDEN